MLFLLGRICHWKRSCTIHPISTNSLTATFSSIKQGERNFDDLDGIVGELAEICTNAKGQTSGSQWELEVAKKVNLKEKEITEDHIKRMIEHRKEFFKVIDKAQDEYAAAMMDLPGVFNLLTSTAADTAMSAIHETSSSFRTFTEQAMKLDIVGCVKTIFKLGQKIGRLFMERENENRRTTTIFEDKRTLLEDYLTKESTLYSNISAIRISVGLLVTLLKTENLNKNRDDFGNRTLETKVEADVDFRSLKIEGESTKLETRFSELLKSCASIRNLWRLT